MPRSVLVLWLATIGIMATAFLVVQRDGLWPSLPAKASSSLPASTRFAGLDAAANTQPQSGNRLQGTVDAVRREAETADISRPVVPGTTPAAPAMLPSLGGTVTVNPEAKFVHFRVGDRNVRRIFRAGPVIWVATTGGVVRYDTSNGEYLFFDQRSGLRSNSALHVGRLGSRVVVGTNGGGAALYDDRRHRWKSLPQPARGREAIVHDVMEASNGDAWLATAGGAVRVPRGQLFNRSRWTRYTVKSTAAGLPSDWVYGLAEGKRGEIWLATGAGVARYADGRWRSWAPAQGVGVPASAPAGIASGATATGHFTRPDDEHSPTSGMSSGISPNNVLSIVADRRGVVWAGTWGGGLARFDGRSWRNFGSADGLPGKHVFALHEARDGALWIGTERGLARLDRGEFRVLTTEDGLFSDHVFAVAAGPDHEVWAGGYGGVAHLARN